MASFDPRGPKQELPNHAKKTRITRIKRWLLSHSRYSRFSRDSAVPVMAVAHLNTTALRGASARPLHTPPRATPGTPRQCPPASRAGMHASGSAARTSRPSGIWDSRTGARKRRGHRATSGEASPAQRTCEHGTRCASSREESPPAQWPDRGHHRVEERANLRRLALEVVREVVTSARVRLIAVREFAAACSQRQRGRALNAESRLQLVRS